MIKRGMALCAVLAFASAAFADIEIDLRPGSEGPWGEGEVVNVEAWFVDKDSGHPITGENLLLRGYQLDFTMTDETLKLPDTMNMETDDFDVNQVFDDLPRPSLVFPLGSESELFQMTLPAGGEMLIGNIDVTVNGNGWLDVMNRDDPDENVGAWVRFGFGTGPDDPVIRWSAFTGELNGGQLKLPEPASLALLALGGLAVLRRRRTA